jgi:hypothetical protein
VRYLVLASLLFVMGLAITKLRNDPDIYTPVVRVRTDNGFFMTLIQREATEKSACTQAVDELLKEFGKACPTCNVESTDCSARLTGIDQALAHKDPLPLYVISSNEIRIALLGPPAMLEAQCEAMAMQMAKFGLKSARCVAPILKSHTS